MRNKLFLLIILLGLCSCIYAQTEDWLWAKQYGGTSSEFVKSIAIDSNGNSYIIGLFNETATFGTTKLISSGENDVYIAKIDAGGNFLWATKAGGAYVDNGNGIAVDSSGNCYVTGYFSGDASFGSTSLRSIDGGADVFIAMLDINGKWMWAKQAGGTNYSVGESIALDSAADIYVTGSFSGNATFGTTKLYSPDLGVFVAKLDATGNWIWVKQAETTSMSVSRSIAVDSTGSACITGFFMGTIAFGATALSESQPQGIEEFEDESRDIFIAKLDANGRWLWAKQAGGLGWDNSYGIATDSSGNSYVTGEFQDTATFGKISLTSSGENDIFVVKLDSNGSFLWAKQAGGQNQDESYGIATDKDANIYITGFIMGAANFGVATLTSGDCESTFIAKLDTNGTWLWSGKSEGESDNSGYCVAVDELGSPILAGVFGESMFLGTTRLISIGVSDIYIAKIVNRKLDREDQNKH